MLRDFNVYLTRGRGDADPELVTGATNQFELFWAQAKAWVGWARKVKSAIAVDGLAKLKELKWEISTTSPDASVRNIKQHLEDMLTEAIDAGDRMMRDSVTFVFESTKSRHKWLLSKLNYIHSVASVEKGSRHMLGKYMKDFSIGYFDDDRPEDHEVLQDTRRALEEFMATAREEFKSREHD